MTVLINNELRSRNIKWKIETINDMFKIKSKNNHSRKHLILSRTTITVDSKQKIMYLYYIIYTYSNLIRSHGGIELDAFARFFYYNL